MASKIIKIKISKASTMQIQTFALELGIIAKQWLRKVGVKIEVMKQKGENMYTKYYKFDSAFDHQKDYDKSLSYWLRAFYYN